jgi:hypothetical protein
LLAALCKKFPGKTIWIIYDQIRLAERLSAELLTWKCSAVSLPDIATDADGTSIAEPEAEAERMAIFDAIASGKSRTVLCH